MKDIVNREIGRDFGDGYLSSEWGGYGCGAGYIVEYEYGYVNSYGYPYTFGYGTEYGNKIGNGYGYGYGDRYGNGRSRIK
jgi:hypothetical protein